MEKTICDKDKWSCEKLIPAYSKLKYNNQI